MKQLQASIPPGYERVRVQIGLTNSEYAEVTSGLNEGDTIAYITPTTTSSSSTTGSNRTGLGMIGGATVPKQAVQGGNGVYVGGSGGGNFQQSGGGASFSGRGAGG
jgi:HlyD family secretion protein